MIQRLKKLLLSEKKKRHSSFSDIRQEILNKAGRDQFKKMLERGLTIPVGML